MSSRSLGRRSPPRRGLLLPNDRYNPHMQLTPELAAKLEADKQETADLMTFEERALAGVMMFDILVDAMRSGIRLQHPDADERQVERLLTQRLQSARQDEATA